MSFAGLLAALAMAPAARAEVPTPPPTLPIIEAPRPATVGTPAPTPAPAADPGTLKLSKDPSRRLTLAVKVNGKGPFEFLVDTGSDRTVISRELAATLALPPGEMVRIREPAGADDAGTVRIDTLAIGKRVVRHIEAPSLAAANIGGAGMLGVDALRDLHVVMDFKAMHMSSSPSRPEPVDARTIVVNGRNRLGQLILSHSSIRGVPILVVVDSGSEVSIGNPALLKLLTKRALSPHPPSTTQIINVTGRTLTIEQDQIVEADVGGVTIRNMPLGFAALPIFDYLGLNDTPALFLGMDVLSQCERVSVDVRRREATFTLRPDEGLTVRRVN